MEKDIEITKSNISKQVHKMFNPELFGLRKDFSLLNYALLKGWCSKVPQHKLQNYLKNIGDGSIGKETPDCSVFKVVGSSENMCQISTCDFFYPLIEDPYLQGKIAVANVMSDVYAMGVSHIDNIIMILGISRLMEEKEREVITSEMIKGFNDACAEGNTKVTGGQTVYNPWPMIGGTAISTVREENIIYPYNIKVNDILILTKPLGTQVVVNTIEWRGKKNELSEKISKIVNDDQIDTMYSIACESMCRLNMKGAELMKKYNAHGATDVTGFGLLGHAQNLVEAQKENFEFFFETLPLIRYCEEINFSVFDFGLLKGESAETSGGLLIALDPATVKEFINEMEQNKQDAWVIGVVKESITKKVTFSENLNKIYI